MKILINFFFQPISKLLIRLFTFTISFRGLKIVKSEGRTLLIELQLFELPAQAESTIGSHLH